MSFAKFIAGDVLLFLFAALTLPLWLPFWAWIKVRNWYDEQRFWWECQQARLRRDAERAKNQAQGSRSREE